MKAYCTHGRPWFRCGECTGETCSAGSGERSEMYVLMMTGVRLVDTPTSRHLAAMRAAGLERHALARYRGRWARIVEDPDSLRLLNQHRAAVGLPPVGERLKPAEPVSHP